VTLTTEVLPMSLSLQESLSALALSLIVALPVASQPAPSQAGPSQVAPSPATAADPRAAIAAAFPDVRPDQIAPSPIPGLYEVRIGSQLAYVSADGRYLLQGEIIDLTTDKNLTEGRRNALRRDVLAGVSESEMIVFAPANPTSTVTVFTDVDCGYCRKLHKQIAAYNAKGIKVRYMYFPRSGPGTASWTTAEQVACSKDRQAALTRAKLGEVLTNKPCQPNPVARDYKMGREFGVQGTPAIILESGELIGGYLDPAELAQYIADTKAPQKKVL
jgi:thiol:disulfide interchange protein DsbC